MTTFLSNLYQKPLGWLAAAVLLAGAAGCTREPDTAELPKNGDPVEVHFDVNILPENTMTTRASTPSEAWDGTGLHLSFNHSPQADTRTGEDEITHLWIFQYATSGEKTGMLIAYDKITDTDLPTQSDGTYKIKATLAYAKDCEIFFVANSQNFGYDQSLVSLSGAKTKNHLFDPMDENPMVGRYTGAIPNDYMWVSLERIMAKIKLRIINTPTNGKFTLNSVEVKSIPKIGRYYNTALDDNTWTFPDISSEPDDNNAVFGDLPASALTSDLSGTVVEAGTWYMPENRRGLSGTEISDPKNKWIGIAPSYLQYPHGKAYETHIVLNGSYTANDGSPQREATITFFPGDQKNLNNDFNIVRNTSYDITASLGTIADYKDKRIVLTSLITYKYYRKMSETDASGDESAEVPGYVYLGMEYQEPETLSAGDPFPDIEPHLNAMKPVEGNYNDGMALYEPEFVSENDADNIVTILYAQNQDPLVTFNYYITGINTPLREPRTRSFSPNTVLTDENLTNNAGIDIVPQTLSYGGKEYRLHTIEGVPLTVTVTDPPYTVNLYYTEYTPVSGQVPVRGVAYCASQNGGSLHSVGDVIAVELRMMEINSKIYPGEAFNFFFDAGDGFSHTSYTYMTTSKGDKYEYHPTNSPYLTVTEAITVYLPAYEVVE